MCKILQLLVIATWPINMLQAQNAIMNMVKKLMCLVDQLLFQVGDCVSEFVQPESVHPLLRSFVMVTKAFGFQILRLSIASVKKAESPRT